MEGLVLNGGTGLRNLFYSQDHERGITLSGDQQANNRELKISPLFEISNLPKDSKNNNGSSLVQIKATSSTTEQPMTGFKFNFTFTDLNRIKRKKKWYEAIMRLDQQDGQINIKSNKKYKETTLARFLHSRRELYSTNFVDEMLNEKRKADIVNCLKSIEPKVLDARTGLNGIVAVDIGLDNFLLVNYLGDGVVRILSILTSIYGTKNGILMIDEVENGLHVDSIKYIWSIRKR